MSIHRLLFPALLMILSTSVPSATQGRSSLLNRIVASVKKANPKWHFIPGVCTCPALVRSQSSYAMGGWHLGKLTSRRHVSIYISYVPTPASATDWMADLAQRNVEKGWHREHYPLPDEAYLWTSDAGYAYIYFRSGSIVVEVSGAHDDVKFFAPYASPQVTPDNSSLNRTRNKQAFHRELGWFRRPVRTG